MVNGILLLDKPIGITSNKALQIVKRLFQARKAGHSGSLDPLATGLLPICFGEATKFSRFLLDADKHYEVTACLGIRTDSGDSEGKKIAERAVPLFKTEEIEVVLDQFRGNITQIPSMYSALKFQGLPLYKWAREGIVIERNARAISISLLRILAYQDNLLSLEVKVSKGTYIRTLVDDIGEVLGCGAHVVSLRRCGAGPYTANQMISMETLISIREADGCEKLDTLLLSLTDSVVGLPAVVLSDDAAYYIRQGQVVVVPGAPSSGWVKLLLQNNQLVGVGEMLEDGKIAPRRLISQGVDFLYIMRDNP